MPVNKLKASRRALPLHNGDVGEAFSDATWNKVLGGVVVYGVNSVSVVCKCWVVKSSNKLKNQKQILQNIILAERNKNKYPQYIAI